jgi:hypothetical protein
MHVFLTEAIVEGEDSTSHSGLFDPVGRAPITRWIGWAPEQVWRTWRPYGDSKSSVVQSVASRYTECSIPATDLS